jgi:hypothetical protein
MKPASKERLRQQMLLRSLWTESGPESLLGCAMPVSANRDSTKALSRAWQAYSANAHANSERALAATFPTVQQLMGDESFANMARAYWHAHPPSRGDLAWLGEALPDFIESSEQLHSETYMADTARLDWAVNQCELAADAEPNLNTLALLGERDPAQLRLHLPPGSRLIPSSHPIVSIWLAHHQPADQDDRFADVRVALDNRKSESALVWRQGWKAQVREVRPADVIFVSAVLAGANLGAALDAAGAGWDFEAWLTMAVSAGMISHASEVDDVCPHSTCL